MYYLVNTQTQQKDMPNIWSKMNTNRININVSKLPANGEVLLQILDLLRTRTN